MARYFTLSIFIALFLFTNISMQAQKVMQIEKVGSLKNYRYMAGDEFEYQILSLPGVWSKATIIEVLTDQNVVHTTNGLINLATITKIRKKNESRFKNAFVIFLYSSAISTIIYSGRAWILGTPPNWISLTMSTAPFLVGYLIQKIFKYKTMRMGPGYRLRAIDLTFYPQDIRP